MGSEASISSVHPVATAPASKQAMSWVRSCSNSGIVRARHSKSTTAVSGTMFVTPPCWGTSARR